MSDEMQDIREVIAKSDLLDPSIERSILISVPLLRQLIGQRDDYLSDLQKLKEIYTVLHQPVLPFREGKRLVKLRQTILAKY